MEKTTILIGLSLILKMTYAQDDSCSIQSHFFQSDSNLCHKMGLVESFRWLTKNCITNLETTVDEVEQIFGLGGIVPRTTVTYAEDTGDNPHYEGRDFDFYWEYGIGFLCDEKGEIINFPGSYGRIFFKNGVVVNYGTTSRG